MTGNDDCRTLNYVSKSGRGRDSSLADVWTPFSSVKGEYKVVGEVGEALPRLDANEIRKKASDKRGRLFKRYKVSSTTRRASLFRCEK